LPFKIFNQVHDDATRIRSFTSKVVAGFPKSTVAVECPADKVGVVSSPVRARDEQIPRQLRLSTLCQLAAGMVAVKAAKQTGREI
jgi:hypothetical protein